MTIQHLGTASLCLLLAIAGCSSSGKSPVAGANPAVRDGVINAVQLDSPDAPRDAQPTLPVVFQLLCYQVTVPVGTVSRNETFWKRIDENALDPVRYDLLRRNGLRLGVAPVAEFEGIRAMLMEDEPGPAKAMGTLGAEVKNIELLMRKDIPFQTVNYYGENNEHSGKTFDKCENIYNVSYRRTPRKQGDMRLQVTPMVRGARKHIQYSAKNEELPIQFVSSQKFYLNIEVDIPMEQFLVLGPSDTTDTPTILGHQFMVKDEPAQQMETVLIFVAQPFRTDEPKP